MIRLTTSSWLLLLTSIAAPPYYTAASSCGAASRGINATLDLAQQLQCPDAAVAMPCPNHTAHAVFHLHIAKMAGRTVLLDAPALALGRAKCTWSRGSSWGPGPLKRFIANARAHADESAAAGCFASFEGDLAPIADAFVGSAPAARAAPVVLTMMRAPVSWALSAIEHMRNHGREYSVEDAAREECLAARGDGVPGCKWNVYKPYGSFALGRLGFGALDGRSTLPCAKQILRLPFAPAFLARTGRSSLL
jgi:hypothetical protein